MSQRFFVDPPISSGNVTLVGAEAHHLTHVMRAKIGDEITLFDGSGDEFTASIASIGRREVTAEVTAKQPINREASRRVSLGIALPKGDRQRWLVEKAVELGVAEITPLAAERSQPAKGSAGAVRLAKAVIEASKQCGRNRLMTIHPPQTPAEFFSACPAAAIRLIAHPEAEGVTAASQLREWESTAEVYLAVGPEGGFTDAELKAATEANWQAVELGQRILRIETAALALATLATLGE